MGKKRMTFSSGFTKKLEEPYNCAQIKLTGPRTGCKLWSMRFVMHPGGSHDQEQDWEVLISHYGGNPLALKLVAQVIGEVFGGTITAFLTEGELFFRDVGDVLEQQMKRLSMLEEEILYWLAIEREAVTLSDLRENIVHSPTGCATSLLSEVELA